MRMRKLCHSHSVCVCKTRYPPEAKLKVRIENPVITRSSNRNLRLFRCRTSSSSNSKKSISSQHFYFFFTFPHVTGIIYTPEVKWKFTEPISIDEADRYSRRIDCCTHENTARKSTAANANSIIDFPSSPRNSGPPSNWHTFFVCQKKIFSTSFLCFLCLTDFFAPTECVLCFYGHAPHQLSSLISISAFASYTRRRDAFHDFPISPPHTLSPLVLFY